MQKNLMLVGILFVALIGYMSGQSGWSISNLTEARAGNVMPLPQNPQERPPTAPSEVLALQSPQSQAGCSEAGVPCDPDRTPTISHSDVPSIIAGNNSPSEHTDTAVDFRPADPDDLRHDGQHGGIWEIWAVRP